MEPRKITEETLAAFARQLGEEERSPATLEKYLREVRQFAAFLGGREVTRELAAAWRGGAVRPPVPRHGQRQADCPGPPAGFSGLGGLPGEAPAGAAAAVPGLRPGAQPGGVRPAGGDGPPPGAGSAVPADGDHLCHRHPGQRGALYHGGRQCGRAGRRSP